MVQVFVQPVVNQARANEYLRTWQKMYPLRKIIGVSMTSSEFPAGYLMTVTYEVEA